MSFRKRSTGLFTAGCIVIVGLGGCQDTGGTGGPMPVAASAAASKPQPPSSPNPQVPLAGSAIPQFVSRLPTLSLDGGTLTTAFATQRLRLRMCEFQANVLPAGTFAPGVTPKTWVFGYLLDPTGEEACPQLIARYTNPATGAVDTYTGPALVGFHGTPAELSFINELGFADETNVLAYKYGTDQTIHWADPVGNEENRCMMMGMPEVGSDCAKNYSGPIPAAVHLHGGEVPPEIDGGPNSWFTSTGLRGHGYYSYGSPALNEAIYVYPNRQGASLTWFHDHTLGATRLNVYAGLAGAYLQVDPSLTLPAGLSQLGTLDGEHLELVVPLVLQDRMFDTDGQLYFPAGTSGGDVDALNPDHPYWVPEFVGDTIVVNGKAWPYLEVAPKRYMFWLINGSNARTYEMFLIDQARGTSGPPLYVIATDGGYLDKPVKLDAALAQKLLMMPGERYLVMIDFAGYAGRNLLVRNTARTPYPKGDTAPGNTLGRILQFRVTRPFAGPDRSFDPATLAPLRAAAPLVRLVDPVAGALAPGVTAQHIRQLTLNEIMGMPMTAENPVTGETLDWEGGPLEILVNNTKWSGHSPRPYRDFTMNTVNGLMTHVSEVPREGDVEIWEIVNTTADAHPIHLHLAQFQLLNRQAYRTSQYRKAYDAAFPAVADDPVCTGGVFCPGFGPPLDYHTGNPRALGGNPDVVPFLQGPAQPPLPNEAGWKDTVIMYPGEVTRIAVRWAPTALPTDAAAADLHFPFDPSGPDGAGGHYGYVWHCHIVDHEDNEMMRPDVVTLNPDAPAPAERLLGKGRDY